MKKRLLIMVLWMITAGTLLACSPQTENAQFVEESKTRLIPGTYRAEFDQPDSRGWTPFLVMKINDEGKIAEVNFDYISTEGTFKTQDADYNQRMTAANGLGPQTYCPRFAKNLIIYQDPAQVDGITGATSSSQEFKQLAQAAYAAAEKGSQGTVYLSYIPEGDQDSGEGDS